MLQALDLKSVGGEVVTRLPCEFLFPDFPLRLDSEKLESESWRQFKSKNREERFAVCLSSIGFIHDDIVERAVILFNILAYIQKEELWRADSKRRESWNDWVKDSTWFLEVKEVCGNIYKGNRYRDDMLVVRAAWPDRDERSLLALINKGGENILTPAYATAFARIARTRISWKDMSCSLNAWLEVRQSTGSHRMCSSVDLQNYCSNLLSGKCPGISPEVLSTLRQERKRSVGASKRRIIEKNVTQNTAAFENNPDSTSSQPSRNGKAKTGSWRHTSDPSRGLSLQNNATVSPKNINSAATRKRKAHFCVEDKALHQRSSPPAIVEKVMNSSTITEHPIINNVTHCFIWISGSEYSESIGETYFEGFTIPKVDIGMHTIASICPTFENRNFAALCKALGYGYAFTVNKVQKVHQGVLMMEIVKHNCQRRTIYHKFELPLAQSVDKILEASKTTNLNGGYDAVIILDYDSNPECVERLRALASYSDNWSRACPKIRMFPHEEELEWYHCKVNDIAVLDELAHHAEVSGEHDMAYRPLTCYGVKVCSLIGRETIMKAGYSSETRHVRHLGLQRDPMLLCRLREDDPQVKVDLSDPHVYFHQETIHTFRTLGEFRVLISTVPKQGALRGREAHVVFMLRTSFRGSRACMPFLPLSGSESFWGTVLPLTIDKLREYAVSIFNALRQRADWREHFETLEVGVRLDIGVSDENNRHRFFVNEVTRFQQGNWFSTVDAPPHYQYPAALARALDAYFPKPVDRGTEGTFQSQLPCPEPETEDDGQTPLS